jgi:hypothetical protein
MGPNEKKHEKIQMYLDDSMSAADRTAFEQDMQQDQELAEEVAINRDMQEMLGNSDENQLLENLKRISDDENFRVKKRNNNWKYWLLLLPIVLILGGLWYGSRDMTTSEVEQQDIVVPQEEVQNLPEPKTTEKNQAIQPEPTEKVIAPIKTSPPKKKTPQKEVINEPIAAADYTPNPSMDFLIANNTREASLVFEVQKKQPKRKINAKDQAVLFEVAATLSTEENIDSKDFKLHLFSNKKEDFENFEPLSTFDLNWQPDGENSYRIDLKEQINIRPGLYYYLIEDFNTEKIYYVEKFEVRLD